MADPFCFRFITTEQSDNNSQYIGSDSAFNFKGTEVYYKIYNNHSDMTSRENTIDSLNTSSSSSASLIVDKLIKTYGYQPLCFTADSDEVRCSTPFIRAKGDNRYVYIRLNDYGTSETFQSGICVGDISFDDYNPVYDYGKFYGLAAVRPVRRMDKPYGFNFNSGDEDYNPLPQKDDPDTYLNDSASEEGKWYVDMYAFSSGSDVTLTTSYSNVLFLGSITISEADYNK